MKNPDKYLREGYLAALQAQGLTVFNKSVPVDIIPVPTDYVLVEAQVKNPTERSKSDFEWDCKITLHIAHINTRGFTETSIVDDMVEKCINAIEAGISVNGFCVKSTYFTDSKPLDVPFKTGLIEQIVLVYEHWLAEIITT